MGLSTDSVDNSAYPGRQSAPFKARIGCAQKDGAKGARPSKAQGRPDAFR